MVAVLFFLIRAAVDHPLPPTAAFIASSTSIEQGGSITFTDQSTNGPTTWSWSFAGGSPSASSVQNPQVTYNQSGTYAVTLTVSNNDGSDTETKAGYITVTAPLIADFTANPRTITAGDRVSFTDNSAGSPSSWNWTFPGGNPSSANIPNPQVVYSNPGTYQVQLRVSNVTGRTDTETKAGFIVVDRSTRSVSFRPDAIRRLCPTHIGGDRDFNGHGPEVSASVRLRIENSREIWVQLDLNARETRPDHTEAEGRWADRLLFTAPAGEIIRSIDSDMRSDANYTDTDHDVDAPSVQGGNLASRFLIRGDTGGNDVGNCTDDDVYMTVEFNEVRVTLERL